MKIPNFDSQTQLTLRHTASYLGGLVLFLLLGMGCGNAEINWARLVESNAQKDAPPPSPPLPTITQRKVQVGFGQGVATASGVTAHLWMKTGTSLGSYSPVSQPSTPPPGTGVSLRNVTLIR